MSTDLDPMDQVLYEYGDDPYNKLEGKSKREIARIWATLLDAKGIPHGDLSTRVQTFGEKLIKKRVADLESRHLYVEAGRIKQVWHLLGQSEFADWSIGTKLQSAISIHALTFPKIAQTTHHYDGTPPVRYHGSKIRIATKLVSLMPRHEVYVEPFCGSAAVLFAKPHEFSTEAYVEILNDLNGDVVNFWRVVKEDAISLQWELACTPASRQEYELAFDTTDGSGNPLPDGVEKARRFYVRSMLSVLHHGNPNEFTALKVKQYIRCAGTLREAAARMESVGIENMDALSVIQKYDSPETLHYCDPPYPETQQAHYGGFTVDDYQAVVDALDECKGAWMVSGYPHDGIVWPSNVTRHVLTTKRKAGTPRECVWVRQRKGTLKDEVQERFDRGDYDVFNG